ncbi:hypothetical protein MICA_558 [Micavibrio aeruginosavorus ARL-13]|uniref:Uncharacterized protein n=2 Tax=Micavibrio aeruginosavorus TaxID=349221 RepID=G2KMW3_MICAA|nr:hypothetical protein MICA_558 [Micavibrio aeruginosavorus ARL-13]
MEVAAFAQGLRAATLPFKYRNHNPFTPDQVEDFDVVVVSGLRDKGTVIRDAYAKKGKPVIVIDYGYMSRVSGIKTWATGHWQVGLNRLGWVPPFQCLSDRLDRLGIFFKPQHDGEYVLVCGQHVGDPSHGLDADGISAWATREIAKAKGARPVLWRPHPDSPDVNATGHDGISSGPIDWASVHAVHCINSNVGHEAIINGVRVICEPSAPYAELPMAPSEEQKRVYFSRLAYSQWTLDEMRSGEAIEFIINAIRRLQ